MLTLGAYALYAERPSLVRYLAVFGCLALGLMSKPMLVTVPFVLLLLDYWPLDRFRHVGRPRSAGRIALVVRSLARGLAAGGGKDPAHGPGGGELRDRRVDAHVLSAGRFRRAAAAGGTPGQCPVFVCGLLGPIVLSSRFGSLLSLSRRRVPAAWVAGSLVLWWRSPRSPPTAGAGGPICWSAGCGFWGCSCRSSDWCGLSNHARADRYTYLSQIGLSMALAWAVWTSYQSRQSALAMRGGWLLAVDVRRRWSCCLQPSRGVRLPTGATLRRSGRMRSLAPSRT